MFGAPRRLEANFIASTSQLLHVSVKHCNLESFQLTVVYRSNSESERKALWKEICNLSKGINDPWSLLGDFNAVRISYDRFGIQPPSESGMRDFSHALRVSNLLEFPGKGPNFTWNNCQQGEDFVISKINRR